MKDDYIFQANTLSCYVLQHFLSSRMRGLPGGRIKGTSDWSTRTFSVFENFCSQTENSLSFSFYNLKAAYSTPWEASHTRFVCRLEKMMKGVSTVSVFSY